MKVFCAVFMCSQFGFVILWQKDFCAKAAHIMLVKLTPVWSATQPSTAGSAPGVKVIELVTSAQDRLSRPGNTKGESITVPLTSCLTGLESAV